MGMLLNGIMAKGATEEEVSALLDAAFNIDGFNPLTRPAFPSSKKTITVAGSGKKGLKTVSISSLAAGDCHGGSDCGGGCGGWTGWTIKIYHCRAQKN